MTQKEVYNILKHFFKIKKHYVDYSWMFFDLKDEKYHKLCVSNKTVNNFQEWYVYCKEYNEYWDHNYHLGHIKEFKWKKEIRDIVDE